MQMEVKEQIERLRNELHRHNYNYYVLNAPEISDQEFDRMMRELQDLEAAHPEFDDPDSPTRRVGSDLNQEFVQVPTAIPCCRCPIRTTSKRWPTFMNASVPVWKASRSRFAVK